MRHSPSVTHLPYRSAHRAHSRPCCGRAVRAFEIAAGDPCGRSAGSARAGRLDPAAPAEWHELIWPESGVRQAPEFTGDRRRARCGSWGIRGASARSDGEAAGQGRVGGGLEDRWYVSTTHPGVRIPRPPIRVDHGSDLQLCACRGLGCRPCRLCGWRRCDEPSGRCPGVRARPPDLRVRCGCPLRESLRRRSTGSLVGYSWGSSSSQWIRVGVCAA
jgi:hypothetical protein